MFAAFSLQIADLTHLWCLSEDLDAFDPSDLLALAKASQIELKVSEDGPLCVGKNLLDLFFREHSLREQALQGICQDCKAALSSDAHLLRCLLIQQVKRLPEGLKDLTSDIRIGNIELSANKD